MDGGGALGSARRRRSSRLAGRRRAGVVDGAGRGNRVLVACDEGRVAATASTIEDAAIYARPGPSCSSRTRTRSSSRRRRLLRRTCSTGAGCRTCGGSRSSSTRHVELRVEAGRLEIDRRESGARAGAGGAWDVSRPCARGASIHVCAAFWWSGIFQGFLNRSRDKLHCRNHRFTSTR